MLNYELKSSPLEVFYKDLLYNIAFHCNNRINDYYEKLLLVFKGLYPIRDLSLVVINSFDDFHSLQNQIIRFHVSLGLILANVHDYNITTRLTIL